MRVPLGAMACAGVRAHLGGDMAAAAEKSVFHYASRLAAGRRPAQIPGFLTDEPLPDPVLVVEVALAPDLEELMEREAERQGVSLERLAAHAVLVYLAELDFLNAPGREAGEARG